MYLRGNRWTMTRRTRRSNPWRIALLLILIGAGLYVNQFVVPAMPAPFLPTPTATFSPESFVNQAEQLYQEGKLAQAIEAYQQAIAVDPNNPANYIDLARIQVFAGQYEDAVVNAQNALLQNSGNSMAHAVEGWALGFTGDPLAAEASVRRAIEIDPNNALAHAYYAEILLNKSDPLAFEDLEKASAESKIARDLDSSLLEVHRSRALVLLNFGTENLEEAISELKAAIAINDKISDLHLNLGYAYELLEENDLAVEELLMAYALNPNEAAALIEAARVYAKEGQFGKAVQHAEQALKVDPSNPRFHGFLGIMYYRNQELSKAIDELALAVHGGTTVDGIAVEGLPLDYGTIPQYYWFYGFALAKSNRCAEAVPIFQALLNGVQGDELAVENAQAGLELCMGVSETPGAEGAAAATEEAGEDGAAVTEEVQATVEP
jgi:tetratricopeptide (TPR) repeat protein